MAGHWWRQTRELPTFRTKLASTMGGSTLAVVAFPDWELLGKTADIADSWPCSGDGTRL